MLPSLRRSLPWVVIPLFTAMLAFLGVSARRTHDDTQALAQSAEQVVGLRSTIRYLNDYASLIAVLGAATGEERWASRYEEIVPQLDAAIREATGLASPVAQAALASTMVEAHRDLIIMERRALAMARSGDASARALLEGPEYLYLREVYDNGTNVFAQELSAIAEQRAANLAVRTRLETVGLALSAILFGATLISFQGRRRLQAAFEQTSIVARTDALTGLSNRRRFGDLLTNAIATGRKLGVDHALMLIDLDRFKPVNDAHGHPAGDELLRMVAARLRSVLGNDDAIGRLGGDEFAFVMCCDPATPDRPRADPQAVAERVVEALGRPFLLPGGLKVEIGASVGVSIVRAGRTSVDALMRDADAALYLAKTAGRSCARQFEPEPAGRARSRDAEPVGGLLVEAEA